MSTHDSHFVYQMLGTGIFIDDKQYIANIDTGSTLQLRIIGNIAGQTFIVAVEADTYQFTFCVEDRRT